MKKGACVWEDWEPQVWRSPNYVSLRMTENSLWPGHVPEDTCPHCCTCRWPLLLHSTHPPCSLLPALLTTRQGGSFKIGHTVYHSVKIDTPYFEKTDLGTSSLLWQVGRLRGGKDPETLYALPPAVVLWTNLEWLRPKGWLAPRFPSLIVWRTRVLSTSQGICWEHRL